MKVTQLFPGVVSYRIEPADIAIACRRKRAPLKPNTPAGSKSASASKKKRAKKKTR